MTVSDSILSRIAVLETRLENHETLHNEFMKRTDDRLDILVEQSNQWTGVRKTLTVLVSMITIVGGFMGWMIHEFFPHGFKVSGGG